MQRRPYLVPKGPAPRSPHNPLELWHLLSLDAPSVAACWTIFLQWCAGVPASLTDGLAMFTAVWILYAADRLLDAKPLFQQPFIPELAERHRFHHTHRKRFLRTLVFASVPLAMLLHLTDAAVLHLYVLLVCLLFAWLCLVHARSAGSATAHRLPKEVMVGLFFPAAVFVPTIARLPALRSALLPWAVLLGALCTLNCLFLYAWEHSGTHEEGHITTRWGTRHLRGLATGLTLTVAVSAIVLKRLPIERTPLAHVRHPLLPLLAAALSSAALLGLDWLRGHLRPTTLRALADLVLLTPVPLSVLQLLMR